MDEIWAWDLYHSRALVEVFKSLAPLNVKGHGKVVCQKTPAKVWCMVHTLMYWPNAGANST